MLQNHKNVVKIFICESKECRIGLAIVLNGDTWEETEENI